MLPNRPIKLSSWADAHSKSSQEELQLTAIFVAWACGYIDAETCPNPIPLLPYSKDTKNPRHDFFLSITTRLRRLRSSLLLFRLSLLIVQRPRRYSASTQKSSLKTRSLPYVLRFPSSKTVCFLLREGVDWLGIKFLE